MQQRLSGALRVVFVTGVVLGVLAACGSEGGSSFVGGGDVDSGTSGTAPPGQLGGGKTGSSDSGGGGVSNTDCKPKSCADQGIECGPAGDGCGGIIEDCGSCGAGLRCGGPGTPSKCVSPNIGTACTPQDCASQGVACGMAGDGCGGTITCPSCGPHQQCGATGMPSKCVDIVATGPGGTTCVPKTCADYKLENRDCGTQSDGCGGTVDCGGCAAAGTPQDPFFCGGGGPSKCGDGNKPSCTPKTCAEVGAGKCGPQPDGCGGVTTSCGSCTLPAVCGGGGVDSVCGGGTTQGPDGGTCTPLTVAACGANQCGKIADSCGGVVDCGTAKCTGGAICGGAGVANQCGKPTCVPITTCPAGLNCGSIADGCGGAISCGGPTACTGVQICGGGGIANQCGGGGVTGPDGGGSCVPKTCAQTGLQCGPVADGCGGIATCPNCTSPQICGANNMPSICGGSAQCTPKTAAACPATKPCGFMADGCGGLVNCGTNTCAVTETCVNNSCGTGTGTCTNYCLDQPTDCGATNTTEIHGHVFAPNQTLPIFGALVYVPNGSVDAVPTGIDTCDSCDSPASGEPLIKTTTGYDGFFTLPNMPVRAGGVDVVIQKGRWRKQIKVTTSKCNPTLVDVPTTSFGSTQSATNNIPLYAVTSGGADSLQCLLRKIGIADSEFRRPDDTTKGRVHLYHGSEGTTAFRDGFNGYTNAAGTTTWPDETTLYTTTAKMLGYDGLVLSCNSGGNERQGPQTGGVTPASGLDQYRANMKAYADDGGKVFASHWNHGWLQFNPSPWGTTPTALAVFDNQADLASPINATVNTANPKGNDLAKWLGGGVAKTTISVIGAQHTIDSVDQTRVNMYISIPTSNSIQYFDFNTPIQTFGQPTPAVQCGRMVVTDLHVSTANDVKGVFPTATVGGNNGNCGSATTLNDQEKVLAYMLFDLTSCITPDKPTCTPKTCADYPATTCGPQSDGCNGQTASCNPCPNGQTCGGGGPSKCGGPTCTPKTTCPAGFDCGQAPDGCGGTVNCGVCTAGTTCGGGGVANKCGKPSCTTLTCADQGVECGQTGDGCGGLQTCPPCPAGTTCGGGGVPNKCGKPACTPATKCPAGKNCGDIPDGCGGSVHCGNCTAGQTCGGGGSPNVCGAASCDPKTCAEIGAECGAVSDQCGGVAQCPKCPGEDTGASFCNAQNFCVSQTCTPRTCAQQNITCGPTADGCGVIIQCGDCAPDEACGGGGTPGQCGKNVCAPKSCTDLGAVCGQVADGCGALTTACGDCAGALSCKNGACVTACTPTTCDAAGAHCGSIADGCGGIVDCGPCPVGQTCGFNNQANTCGTDGPK